jgi:hypothetical protein
MIQHIEKRFGVDFMRLQYNVWNDSQTLVFCLRDNRADFDSYSIVRFIQNYFPSFQYHFISMRNISGCVVNNRR